jgi:hypothetical protein
VTSRAFIDCAGAVGSVLRHVRGNPDLAAILDEVRRVVGLVGADRLLASPVARRAASRSAVPLAWVRR